MSIRRSRVPPVESSSASKVDGNYDLLYQILLRLPTKNLIGCKLVSKQWLSLISDTDRVHPNPNQKLVLSGLFFYNSLTKSPSIQSVSVYRNKLPLLQLLHRIIQGASVKIVQSVNGLLLCRLAYRVNGRVSKLFCVCNPTTSDYKLLPQPQKPHQFSISGCSLVFDLSVSLHYKVICVSKFRQQGQIDMYSSENHSWRKCDLILDIPWGGTNFGNGIFWNGGVHWDTYHCAILSFDVDSERMITLPKVPVPSEDTKGGSSYFGESNGCLYYIKVPDICSTHIYVFELHVGGSAWLCRYRVEVSDLVREFPEIRQETKQRGCKEIVNAYSILHVGECFADEEEEGVWMLLAIPGKVVSYNFVTKRVKVIQDLPGEVLEPFKYESFTAFGFMESLFHV